MRFLSCRLYQSWDKKGDTSRIIKKDCFSHIFTLGYIVGITYCTYPCYSGHTMRLSLLCFAFQWKYGKCLPSLRAISVERRGAFPILSSSPTDKIERSRGRRGLDILERIPSESVVSFVMSGEELENFGVGTGSPLLLLVKRILMHNLESRLNRFFDQAFTEIFIKWKVL